MSRRLLKNKLAARFDKRQAEDRTVELWAMDEHRVGLQPILRRVWARKGKRPIAEVRPRYEWLYVYGFVQPQTGETVFWLAPGANSETFVPILEAFLRERGGVPILLVLDGAGWHVSDQTRMLEAKTPLELEYLPAYSPELQPAERLWELCDEPLANKVFDRLQDLEATLAEQCVKLTEETERIRDRTLYHWWPGGTDHPLTD